EQNRVLELEAQVLETQKMLSNSNSQCTILEKHYNDLQLKFQRYKENLKNQRVLYNSNAMASNAIFEITLLKDQLQERDETVQNLQSEINISKMLNLGGDDDSTARMYAVSPKYIVPHCRDNRETPIPVPKKKHVTFREPQSTTRITSKPDTAIKQPNRLSARSGRGEEVAAHLRTLNQQNHVDSSFKRSVFMKNAGCDVCHRCLNFDSYDNRAFNSMNSGTRNHSKDKSSVSTTKTIRKPNVVTPKKPMWKPTGR
nr:hypothetical protein [Tanacetum cinerariifolium]